MLSACQLLISPMMKEGGSTVKKKKSIKKLLQPLNHNLVIKSQELKVNSDFISVLTFNPQ